LKKAWINTSWEHYENFYSYCSHCIFLTSIPDAVPSRRGRAVKLSQRLDIPGAVEFPRLAYSSRVDEAVMERVESLKMKIP
jgi:hypothetical protein